MKGDCNISLNDTSFHPATDLIHVTNLRANLQNVTRVESKHFIFRRMNGPAPKGEQLGRKQIPRRFRREPLTGKMQLLGRKE